MKDFKTDLGVTYKNSRFKGVLFLEWNKNNKKFYNSEPNN